MDPYALEQILKILGALIFGAILATADAYGLFTPAEYPRKEDSEKSCKNQTQETKTTKIQKEC